MRFYFLRDESTVILIVAGLPALLVQLGDPRHVGAQPLLLQKGGQRGDTLLLQFGRVLGRALRRGRRGGRAVAWSRWRARLALGV